MRISLRLAEPGRSSFRLLSRGVVDAVGERAAQLRPGFQQHADGLSDVDRADPVMPAQVVQPCPGRSNRLRQQGFGLLVQNDRVRDPAIWGTPVSLRCGDLPCQFGLTTQ
jgi:hypothetical protein